jgi:phospholipase C
LAALTGCGSDGNQTAPPATVYTSAGLVKHVVVIFQENESFDHYFATYPNALNLPGETPFSALASTPAVDGLTSSLMSQNPNALNAKNGHGATNPFRLSPQQAATADQDHGYAAEQAAFDHGAMDLFPLSVGAADSPSLGKGIAATTGLTMGYYDGNTVTGLWNYAQHYAMSDHAFGTNFGPSTVGAINLISGQTNGAVNDANAEGVLAKDGSGGYTLIGDAEPSSDLCSTTSSGLIHMTGKNIGDLLNASGVSWGFFTGGFDLTATNPNGSLGCGRSHQSPQTRVTANDHIPHHQPFQYYASTANPMHRRPVSVSLIGSADDALTNHQYDTHDFYDALSVGIFPAVSFLKAPAYQDGHAGYSDPLDEQTFVIDTINTLEQRGDWASTVVIIAYDDSDGWYDHEANVINGSATSHDSYTSAELCGNAGTALAGVVPTTLHAHGRCGYGPRLPLVVVSPWAKPNFVDSTVIDQTSILRFIEDTFLNHERIGQGSFDAIAGPMDNLFDFSKGVPQNTSVVLLNGVSGAVTSVK